MAWLRIDDLFPEHPKVELLTDREFRVHMRVMCYCARYKTRGHIPPAIWTAVRGLTRPMGSRFITLGLWDEDGGALSVHDFEKYNPVDPAAAERQARRRSRLRHENVTAESRESHGESHGEVTDPSRKSPSRARARVPSPSRPQPHESESSSDEDSSSSSPPGPDEEEMADFTKALAADLAQAGINGQLATNALTDPKRAAAWLAHIQLRDDVDDVRAYFRSCFGKPGWPDGQQPPKTADVIARCRQFLHSTPGLLWDETTDEETMGTYLQRHAKGEGRFTGRELTTQELDSLLDEWRALREVRYPEVAA